MRLLKLGDHISFAIGNFLLAGYISKNYGDIVFSYYVLGITIALFFYGFFRISFINKIYADLTLNDDKQVAIILFLIISLLGVCFMYLSDMYPYSNVGVFFCVLFLVYFQIDYFRAISKSKNDILKSIFPSFVFVLSVLFFYLVGFFYQYIFLYFCIVLFLSIRECIVSKVFSGGYLIHWFYDAFRSMSAYWLLNSACSHLPVIFLAGKSSLLVGGFYALRSVLGTSAMIIRSLEIDLRINITKFNGDQCNSVIIKFLMKCFFIIGVCSLGIYVFFDFIFLKIYGTNFEMSGKVAIFFGLYVFSCWAPIVVEVICLKASDSAVLRKIRVLDLVLFIVACSLFLPNVDLVEDFITLCVLGNVGSMIYVIYFLNRKPKVTEV